MQDDCLCREDPADRIIALTAIILDLTLLTADERLLGLGNMKALPESFMLLN